MRVPRSGNDVTARLGAVEWEALAERAERRYGDGFVRLPRDPAARQKQLLRMATAAGAAGLARVMEGREAEARGWFVRSAERYRESYVNAPAGSWGRVVGALKARLLAGDDEGARRDAEWALEEAAAASASPIGRYAGALATAVLGDDGEAARLAASLRGEEFPAAVAAALAALAASDGDAYADALGLVLRDFEARQAFLEDVPVADTFLVLEALAGRRGLAAGPASPLLPAPR
jgi:hypothetical protein